MKPQIWGANINIDQWQKIFPTKARNLESQDGDEWPQSLTAGQSELYKNWNDNWRLSYRLIWLPSLKSILSRIGYQCQPLFVVFADANVDHEDKNNRNGLALVPKLAWNWLQRWRPSYHSNSHRVHIRKVWLRFILIDSQDILSSILLYICVQ